MFWILALVALSAFCVLTIKRYKYWQKKGVKQKLSFPPFGEFFDSLIKGHHLNFVVHKIYNEFPDARYCGFFEYSKPVLMIRDPQLIKQMCVRDADCFLDHDSPFADDPDPLWRKNLISLKGQMWKHMRSVLTPLFTSSKMRQSFELSKTCADNFIDYFDQCSEGVIDVELKDAFTRYTCDIIASTVFGVECDSLKDPENEFYMKGKQISDYSNWKSLKRLVAPWLGKIIRISRYDQEVAVFFRKIVKEIVEYKEKNNIDRGDLINLLVQLKNGTFKYDDSERKRQQREKVDLSLESITSQALSFFEAGFETTPTALSFLCYELAQNPDIQRKLMEELDEFKVNSRILTYEDLPKLTYLDMTISEILRKYCIPYLERTCSKSYTIEPEFPDEVPIRLSIGDKIWFPLRELHNDSLYWENPEKFDPQRFSAENKDKIKPYAYLPFGIGSRNCIGNRFAMMEIKVILYALLTRYEIVLTKKSCISFSLNKRGFNLDAAEGYWLGLKKRITTDL